MRNYLPFAVVIIGLGACIEARTAVATVAGCAGDYNNNGVCDAADYPLWRDNLGLSVTLPNDTTPGNVTPADFDVWKANFGKTPGGGSVVAAVAAGVPESSTMMLALVFLGATALRSRLRAH